MSKLTYVEFCDNFYISGDSKPIKSNKLFSGYGLNGLEETFLFTEVDSGDVVTIGTKERVFYKEIYEIFELYMNNRIRLIFIQKLSS
jgi:hypothetical protein